VITGCPQAVGNPVDNLRSSPSARPSGLVTGRDGGSAYSETSIVSGESIRGLGVLRDVILAVTITAR
jgi:hypothetical protein